jgi:hypothetical protein
MCFVGMRRTRTVTYSITDDGSLRRTVLLSDGTTYTHHCARDVYEAVAYAMEDSQGHTGQGLSKVLNEPFTQVTWPFSS